MNHKHFPAIVFRRFNFAEKIPVFLYMPKKDHHYYDGRFKIKLYNNQSSKHKSGMESKHSQQHFLLYFSFFLPL